MPSNSTVSPAGAGMRPTFVDDDMMGAVLMSLTISARPGSRVSVSLGGGGQNSSREPHAVQHNTKLEHLSLFLTLLFWGRRH